MARLFINLFFIIIICFTLAVMPINTEILSLFNIEDIFSSDFEETPIIEDSKDDFKPTYSLKYSLDKERIYNPKEETITLITNIPKSKESNFDFKDIELSFYKNNQIYQIFSFDSFVTDYKIDYNDDLVQVIYSVNIDDNFLNLEHDGFYNIEFTFKDKTLSTNEFLKVGYRNNLNYITSGKLVNDGKFTYKTFFLNEDKTQLVPLYFSVDYPESITIEVRNRLYDIPPTDSGLSLESVIPQKSSVMKLDREHYGVFFSSYELNKMNLDNSRVKLMTNSLIQSLTRLPHISKLSFFVDEKQVEGSLFDFDLTKVYENSKSSYVYLTENTSSNKSYLVPIAIKADNIYDEVWTIFESLKTGKVGDDRFIEILSPEIEINNFVIDGTTITVDFNEEFLNTYKDSKDYELLMINSILYSLTSIENINKVNFTVNGEDVLSIGGYDFSEPVGTPPYINYIGEF